MDNLADDFRTMRKYGIKTVTVSHQMDLSRYVKTDRRMPRKRLRRYLGQYGLRCIICREVFLQQLRRQTGMVN